MMDFLSTYGGYILAFWLGGVAGFGVFALFSARVNEEEHRQQHRRE